MSKIICDVCGTRYPESSNQCPICGCVRDAEQKIDEAVISEEEVAETSRASGKGGRFSKANVRKRNKDQLGYDEAEASAPVPAPVPDAQQEEYDSDEETNDGSHRKKNVFLNILLVLVIVALLLVSGYIFVEYFMPNVLTDMLPQNATEATEVTEMPATEAATGAATEAVQTEAAAIPCQQLVADVTDVVLTEEGQMYLLNVQALPEDTTDTVMYISSNEDVATVNEEGRVTAVGEGSVVISVFCGEQQMEFHVTCAFATEAPTEAATEAPAEGETEAPAEGETEAPAEGETEAPVEDPTEEATAPLKDVVLSIKTSDMTFRSRGQQAVIKLTCALTNQEVTWTSSNEAIATVDKDGVITRVGAGTTTIIGQYGDQKVEIIVRCPRK